jgi:SEC-C motif-containing protein
MDCPCCSGEKYDVCCKIYHTGFPAPTPLSLMRSRYSAYALGKADYILNTTHPHSPYYEKDRNSWKRAILQFCKNTQFLRLEILSFEENWVHFIAHLSHGKLDEKSFFEKLDGKWLYLKGEIHHS